MDFLIEIEQEEDGRWIADIPELPGVMVYGDSREEAIAKVKALALLCWQIGWSMGSSCTGIHLKTIRENRDKGESDIGRCMSKIGCGGAV